MRHILIWLSCMVLVTIAFSSIAEEKKTQQQMNHQAMMEAYTRMATPGEPHKLLTSLAGSWITKTKTWMEPGKPPMESSGSAEIKSLLDGRFIQQEFNGEMMGQPFAGLGIDGYDNIRKHYVSDWIDTMGTGIFHLEGTASDDGRTITMSGSHPEPDGKTMSHRAIWTVPDSDHQTFVMYGKHQGGEEMKVMEMVYTRK